MSNTEDRLQILYTLGSSPYEDVRAIVAARTDCTPYLLRKLAQDPEESVVRSVAGNKNCRPDLFEALCSRGDFCKLAILGRDDCPVEILTSLARGTSRDVRMALVQLENCHEDVITLLATDPDLDIRIEALEHPNCPPNVLGVSALTQDPYMLPAALSNPNNFDFILTAFSTSTSSEVRSCIARNHSCPLDVLKSLANDCDEAVRFEVARNPRSLEDQDLLVKLANDSDRSVRMEALKSLLCEREVTLDKQIQ